MKPLVPSDLHVRSEHQQPAATLMFFGDPHGNFEPVIAAVERFRPEAIVLLGDLQARRPLQVELAPLLDRTEVYFIHGNHAWVFLWRLGRSIRPLRAHGASFSVALLCPVIADVSRNPWCCLLQDVVRPRHSAASGALSDACKQWRAVSSEWNAHFLLRIRSLNHEENAMARIGESVLDGLMATVIKGKPGHEQT